VNVNWIAEYPVTWLLPSGEPTEGRIAVGAPEIEEDGTWCCAYAIESLPRTRSGQVYGATSLQALWHALSYVGMWLYFAFVDGVRVYPREEDGTDPLTATASLLGMLGPVIRAPLNPRGVADPEGKIAKLEAIIEEQMLAHEKREGHVERGAAMLANAVLAVLQARDVAVPDTIRDRILAMTNVELLERWLERAAVATSIGDVLDDQG